MKKAFTLNYLALFVIVFVFLCTACNGGSTALENNDGQNESTAITVVIDSISSTLKWIDNIQEQGELFHIETWHIGNLQSVEIRVLKVSIEKDSVVFIQLRKDCGGEYYYSWEETNILKEELPSLYRAIDKIKSNINRKTDHTEKYLYFTKDNVVIDSENSGKGWRLKLSVNSRVKNSFITISPAELDKFVELLQTASRKIDELSHTNSD